LETEPATQGQEAVDPAIQKQEASRQANLKKLFEFLLKQETFPKHHSFQTFLTNASLAVRGVEDAEKPLAPVFENVDVAWSGDMALEKPQVAEVMPGKCMLYRGRMNEQHGEPGIGKSNVALLFAMLEMNAGNDVLFIDPEDTLRGLCLRFAALGADRASTLKHLHYINPKVDFFWKLQLWAGMRKPSLVVVDGLAALISAAGFDEDHAKDFLQFSANYLRPFLWSDAAILITDHVTKSKESRGRHSRGSGAKLGEWDGAVYEIDLIKAYTPTEAGGLRMKVCKDRNGGVGKIGDIALEIHFSPDGQGKTNHRFALPSKGEFSPTRCMEAVSRYLENNPNANAQDVRRESGYKAKVADDAVKCLEKDGFLKAIRPGGGKPNRYEVLKPFRETNGATSQEEEEQS
jgi:hypothetical protein